LLFDRTLFYVPRFSNSLTLNLTKRQFTSFFNIFVSIFVVILILHYHMVNDGLLGLLGLQLVVTQLKVTSKEEEWKGRMWDWKQKKQLEGSIQNRTGGSK
jgi:hypothetical protein